MKKISSIYPKLNTTWLLTGEGKMLRSEITDVTNANGEDKLSDTALRLLKMLEKNTEMLEKHAETINSQQQTIRFLAEKPPDIGEVKNG
jgi:hypothetical protein